MDYTFKTVFKINGCLRSIAVVYIHWDRIVLSWAMNDLLFKIFPIILQSTCVDLHSHLQCGTSLFLCALLFLLFLSIFLKLCLAERLFSFYFISPLLWNLNTLFLFKYLTCMLIYNSSLSSYMLFLTSYLLMYLLSFLLSFWNNCIHSN